jgi:integrase
MLQYLQALKDRVAQGTYGANTFKAKLSRFDCIFKNSDIKNMRVADLTATKITEFMELPLAKNYKANYRVELLATLQSMLNWAAKPVPRRNPERLIVTNPIVGVTPSTRPRVNRYIETTRIRKLYRHVWSRYRKFTNKNQRRDGRLMLLMLRLLRITGARPTEIYLLRWNEIDWKTNQIILPPERHKTGRKTQRNRTIFLTKQAIRILRFVEKLGARPDGYVFGRHNGLWDHKLVGNRIWRYRHHFGIKSPIVAYSSRHAYCTEALADGATLSNVSKMVGNSVNTLANNYDHAINQ